MQAGRQGGVFKIFPSVIMHTYQQGQRRGSLSVQVERAVEV